MNKEGHVGISNKEKVIRKLKSGEIMIKNYQYSVQHDPDCIKAAILGNIENYNDIPDSFKSKKWVGNLYYTKLIEDQEIDELISEMYVDYYPWELVIEKALEDDKINSPVDIIKSVVDDMTDDELENLQDRVGNLAIAFIDPNMNETIADMQENYIISGHKRKVNTTRVKHE